MFNELSEVDVNLRNGSHDNLVNTLLYWNSLLIIVKAGLS